MTEKMISSYKISRIRHEIANDAITNGQNLIIYLCIHLTEVIALQHKQAFDFNHSLIFFNHSENENRVLFKKFQERLL